jgi:hypothetical protein
VMSSWESYPMYTLKGISFVATASLFDIIIQFFRGCFFVRGKKQKTKTKKDGWMEFKNETQERNCFFFQSIDQSKSFFCVCALCVCVFWTLSIFGTGFIYREEGERSTRKCRHAMGCHYFSQSV